MVNSNELYDFARPTLSKIVNIGGVGIKSKDAKPLEQVQFCKNNSVFRMTSIRKHEFFIFRNSLLASKKRKGSL